jgi:hypothetical protein
MPTNKTITINGRAYDAVTGLPISARVFDQVSRVSTPAKAVGDNKDDASASKASASPAAKRDAATAAADVHGQTQRSQTLFHRAAKKPAAPAKRPTTGRHMDMARSAKVTRFAPNPVIKPAEVKKAVAQAAQKPDAPAQTHPVAAKAVARVASTAPVVAKPATSKEVKDASIAQALATPKAKPAKKGKKLSTLHRRLLIIAAVLLVIAAAAYAVYRFVPSVSVSLASAQSGVSATYPEYVPDGFSLNHPVTYSDGEVVLKFKSNSNHNNYTITQTRSSWDSSAVLDNVVRPAAGDNYITTKERGLTVYSYGNNAAWVNGGVLYVIASNNAPLSGEQIRRIATSL